MLGLGSAPWRACLIQLNLDEPMRGPYNPVIMRSPVIRHASLANSS